MRRLRRESWLWVGVLVVGLIYAASSGHWTTVVNLLLRFV